MMITSDRWVQLVLGFGGFYLLILFFVFIASHGFWTKKTYIERPFTVAAIIMLVLIFAMG
jgi:hypothetical protein